MSIFVVLQCNVPVHIQHGHREHSDVSAHVPVSGKRARLRACELWFTRRTNMFTRTLIYPNILSVGLSKILLSLYSKF